MEKNYVVLSSPMLLEVGNFNMVELSIEQATQWVEEFSPKNYVGHSTSLIVGLAPATTREVCSVYDQALALKPQGRLEFGREYTKQELLEVGISCFLITKTPAYPHGDRIRDYGYRSRR